MANEPGKDTAVLGESITRRDFIGSTLVGAGAALLSLRCPAAVQRQEPGPEWTGFGGVGDYRFSNGNTADVVRSAHRIRDGFYDSELLNVVETGESYDVVVVGAGFAGTNALYEFKKVKPNGTCLLIDNHPIFGGEAKQNEFDVDGCRLVGPQGSNAFVKPAALHKMTDESYRYGDSLWRELGLPESFEFARREGGNPAIIFDKENFDAMYTDTVATVGYYFRNQLTGGKGVWVKSIWSDDLKRAPLPQALKKDLLKWRDYKGDSPIQARKSEEELGPWLDSMTVAEFATKVVGLSPEVFPFADPGLAAGMYGVATDALSAYTTRGSGIFGERNEWNDLGFPGGNAGLLRHFVKAIFPDAITGPKRFDAILNNPVNLSVLDRSDSKLKMRLSSTAVRVKHIGDPSSAEFVEVVYENAGQVYRVKAKGVVLAIGSWVARHIVKDVPASYQEALAGIPHGPILSVNVALRNWRFFDKLGISAARWFEGFGFFANIRHPMVVGNRPTPFHPDKPALLTFYVPFLRPGTPIAAQGALGRQELYGTSYAEFERKIVAHMERLFSSAGFDAKRDIAGIVINRWGHALFAPPPGFFFGKDGKPSPRTVLRERFGRIAFGHSELGTATTQSWETAATEGKRSLTQVLEVV